MYFHTITFTQNRITYKHRRTECISASENINWEKNMASVIDIIRMYQLKNPERKKVTPQKMLMAFSWNNNKFNINIKNIHIISPTNIFVKDRNRNIHVFYEKKGKLYYNYCKEVSDITIC